MSGAESPRPDRGSRRHRSSRPPARRDDAHTLALAFYALFNTTSPLPRPRSLECRARATLAPRPLQLSTTDAGTPHKMSCVKRATPIFAARRVARHRARDVTRRGDLGGAYGDVSSGDVSTMANARV